MMDNGGLVQKLLDRMFGRWEYIGTFEGHVSAEDGESPFTRYYVLEQRGRERRSKVVDGLGRHQSRHSVWAAAQVAAWERGGPLPDGLDHGQDEPEHRPKAELIVFPGGKSA